VASELDERWRALEPKYERLLDKVQAQEREIVRLREQVQQLRGGGK
jgi:hypothetical protein